MIRPLVIAPDERLNTVCLPALRDNTLTALINDLLDTMYFYDGVGLAAPQIGVLKRVFVMDVRKSKAPHNPIVFVNPRILSKSGSAISEEGCLSMPELFLQVKRATQVRCAIQPEASNYMTLNFHGMEARVIQHEIDHLEGVLFDSRAISTEQTQTAR